jgi:hypothetical protein
MNAAANGVEPAPSSGDDLFEAHLNMVRAIVDNAADGADPAVRRALEQRVRQRAVACALALAERGHDRIEAALRLGLAERTLRQWEHDLDHEPESVPSLGRPPADSGAEPARPRCQRSHASGSIPQHGTQ